MNGIRHLNLSANSAETKAEIAPMVYGLKTLA